MVVKGVASGRVGPHEWTQGHVQASLTEVKGSRCCAVEVQAERSDEACVLSHLVVDNGVSVQVLKHFGMTEIRVGMAADDDVNVPGGGNELFVADARYFPSQV